MIWVQFLDTAVLGLPATAQLCMMIPVYRPSSVLLLLSTPYKGMMLCCASTVQAVQ